MVNGAEESAKETPEERKRRLANDPYRGKRGDVFIDRGKRRPDGKGLTSHQQRTTEQRGGSLKRNHRGGDRR